MSAWFVAQLRVHDPALYQRYLDGFDAAFRPYGGEVVLVDEAPAPLEGDWPFTRLVLIRFPDEPALRRWYDSEAYRELRAMRHAAADGSVVLARDDRD